MVADLHRLWQELTGQPATLDKASERRWRTWQREGFTAEQLASVIRHIQTGIKADKRNLGALKLANLLDPEKFNADLGQACAVKPASKARPAGPANPPAPQAPPPISDERKRRFLDELRRAVKGLPVCDGARPGVTPAAPSTPPGCEHSADTLPKRVELSADVVAELKAAKERNAHKLVPPEPEPTP